MLKKLTNKKGFTLMEMLIVVAIIAILVAIAIPTFNGALERANQATDAANIRAAYAESSIKFLNGDTNTAVETPAMRSGSWDKVETGTTIGGENLPDKTKGKTITVTVSAGSVEFKNNNT